MSTPRDQLRIPEALMLRDVQHLVGRHEIGLMFGVSRQRTYQLTSRPDFPKPTAELKLGPIWTTAEVVAWAEEKGREIHDADE